MYNIASFGQVCLVVVIKPKMTNPSGSHHALVPARMLNADLVCRGEQSVHGHNPQFTLTYHEVLALISDDVLPAVGVKEVAQEPVSHGYVHQSPPPPPVLLRTHKTKGHFCSIARFLCNASLTQAQSVNLVVDSRSQFAYFPAAVYVL